MWYGVSDLQMRIVSQLPSGMSVDWVRPNTRGELLCCCFCMFNRHACSLSPGTDKLLGKLLSSHPFFFSKSLLEGRGTAIPFLESWQNAAVSAIPFDEYFVNEMFEEEPNNNGDIKSTICPFPIPHRYKFSFSAVANWILMPDLLLATFFFCLRHTYGNISKTALDKVAREWQSSGKRRSGFVVRDCKHGRERREPGNIDAVLSLVSMVTHRTFLRIEFLLTSWTFCHSKLYKWDSCTAISPGTWRWVCNVLGRS